MSLVALDPCVGPVGLACEAAGSVGQGAMDMVFASMGKSFVSAAETVVTTSLGALDATTKVDLGASWFRANVGVLAAVSLPVVVGLFVIQVIGAVLRREPGGLARALLGVGKAVLGSALAIAATKVALTAADGICSAIAASSGASVAGTAGRFLKLTWMSGPQVGPVLQMLLATAVVIGALLLWCVLLFRKAAILLVAVFAPIAFAGSAWDQTRVWTRRWIEAVVSLVFCKVVIVVVFALGTAAFSSTGATTGAGAGQGLGTSMSDVLVGLLLLSIAVFSPWLTWRFVHWSGIEAGTALHREVTGTPVPAAVKGTANSGKFAAQSSATTLLVGTATGGSGAAAGVAANAASASAPRGGGGPARVPAWSGSDGSRSWLPNP